MKKSVMKQRNGRRGCIMLIVILFLLQTVLGVFPPITAEAAAIAKPAGWVTPYEKYGELNLRKVNGVNQLCDQYGTPVQLKGASTFGLSFSDGDAKNEGSWALTDEVFDILAYDWKCDVIRLAMYVTEGYPDTYAQLKNRYVKPETNAQSSNPAKLIDLVEQGINLAMERGMYVIVDWHVLTPGNPNDPLYMNATKDYNWPTTTSTNYQYFNKTSSELTALASAGKYYGNIYTNTMAELKNSYPNFSSPELFFYYLAGKYSNYDHRGQILWELANEPNGLGTEADARNTWIKKLRPYMQKLVNTIRKRDTYGIIICGTDNWDQFVDAPLADPVVDNKGYSDSNRYGDDARIMYTVHFYAGSHDAGDAYDTGKNYSMSKQAAPAGTKGEYWLRRKIDNALKGGLALFCTEFGVSEASGDGGPYLIYTDRWLNYLADKNISWCAWSLARKNEVSSMVKWNAPNGVTSHANVPGAVSVEKGIPYWTKEQLSDAGHYMRSKIRGDQNVSTASDVRYNKNPDKPGSFIKLPFDFESGTREGWTSVISNKIDHTNFSVEKLLDTNALCVNLDLRGSRGAYDYGAARIGFNDFARFPNNNAFGLKFGDVKYITFDLYIERDAAAPTAPLPLVICPIPDGYGYWYDMDSGTINASAGEDVQIGNRTLKKVWACIDLQGTLQNPQEDLTTYEKWREGIPREATLRSLTIIPRGGTFVGKLYFDNVSFITQDKTALTAEFTKAAGYTASNYKYNYNLSAFDSYTQAVKDNIKAGLEGVKNILGTPKATEADKLNASSFLTALEEAKTIIGNNGTQVQINAAMQKLDSAVKKVAISGVTVSPNKASIVKGQKQQFKSIVSAQGKYAKTVTWSIDEASKKKAGTTISADGILTVASDEGLSKLTVRATSTVNPEKFGTATVTLSEIPKTTLTFEPNQGNLAKGEKGKKTINTGNTIGTLPKVVRKGYAFKGWWTKKTGGAQIKTTDKPKADTTYYARWTKVNKPAKVKMSKLVNKKAGKLKVTFKKIKNVDGYEIQRAEDKKFKIKKQIRDNKTKLNYTYSKLEKGKTYYVRVRAYRKDSAGNKIYGKWSTAKNLTLRN